MNRHFCVTEPNDVARGMVVPRKICHDDGLSRPFGIFPVGTARVHFGTTKGCILVLFLILRPVPTTSIHFHLEDPTLQPIFTILANDKPITMNALKARHIYTDAKLIEVFGIPVRKSAWK